MINNIDKEQLESDAYMAKALIWMPGNIIRWCKVTVLAGPNDHGQYHVRRLANGWEAMTTEVRNLTNADKEKIRREHFQI